MSMDKREKLKTMLAEKCWAGYEKKGMKTMFGKRYPNCVKKKANSRRAWKDFVRRDFMLGLRILVQREASQGGYKLYLVNPALVSLGKRPLQSVCPLQREHPCPSPNASPHKEERGRLTQANHRNQAQQSLHMFLQISPRGNPNDQ